MTENEAIKQLQVGYLGDTEDLVRAKHIAIKTLEEIQEYRAIGTVEELKHLKKYVDVINKLCFDYSAIGTVEEFKALKEKNEPKKIEFMHNRSDTVSVWKCHCGNVFLTKHKEGILDGTDVNYCCKCGQKIDWSDDNE